MTPKHNQKVVSFPISIGTVRLMFTKVDDDWICKLQDDFMQDLEDAVNGKVPQERVRWVDLPDLGANNES